MVQNMAQLLSSHIFRTGLRSHKKLQTTILQHPLPVKNLILKQATISPATPEQKQKNCELRYLKAQVSLIVIQDNLVENLASFDSEIVGGNFQDKQLL